MLRTLARGAATVFAVWSLSLLVLGFSEYPPFESGDSARRAVFLLGALGAALGLLIAVGVWLRPK